MIMIRPCNKSLCLCCILFRALDYDFLGPDHKYEFIVTATDGDPVSPLSGTVTVQVRHHGPLLVLSLHYTNAVTNQKMQ